MPWSRSNERHALAHTALGAAPWRREQLLALGWTPRQIDRDVDEGRLARIRRGLYAGSATTIDWSDPASYAAFLAGSCAEAVSHESAARVAGLWLAPDADDRVHVTTEARPLPSDRALRRHRASLPPEDVELRRGVPVTTVPRTAGDLALGRPLPQALRALDAAVGQMALGAAWCKPSGRALLSTDTGRLRERRALDALAAAASRASGRNGSRLLQAALPWVDARSESPYESWSRGVLIEAGLVPEQVGYEVQGASGATYWSDLAWPSMRVLAEVDGLTKFGEDPRTVRERLAAERHRQNDLEDAFWTVARWTAGEKASVIIARVRRALAAAP